jgi:hypothetical protein
LPALARYANLHTVSGPDHALIKRLRQALAEPAGDPSDRATVGFALGRLLDGAGCYAAAFDAYADANRDSRLSAAPGTGTYDPEFEARFIDRLIASFPVKAHAAAAMHAVGPAPIFVCGMFRSGSTLIEQLLARHPRVTAGGELELIPRAARESLAPFPESMANVTSNHLQSVAARYLAKLAELFPGAEFVTDKRPDNFVFIGLIKTLFPSAKIIHTTRDPLDNCLSIYFLHLDHRMSYALDLKHTAHHYLEYRRLMAHWQALYGADILDVNYDEFVREPRPQMTQLLAYLGLDWDDRCLTPPTGGAVKTASVWQVREAIYQTSSGRARNYDRQLSELRAYLQNVPGA